MEYARKLARDNARIKKRIEAAGAQGRDSKQLEGEVKQMIKARVKERELCRARFVQKVDRENRRLVKVLRETPTKVRPKLARDQEKERRMKLKEANLKKMVYNKSLMERNLELMDRLEVASRHGRDEKRLSEAVEEERRYLEQKGKAEARARERQRREENRVLQQKIRRPTRPAGR